jgi:hypothetical protein
MIGYDVQWQEKHVDDSFISSDCVYLSEKWRFPELGWMSNLAAPPMESQKMGCFNIFNDP